MVTDTSTKVGMICEMVDLTGHGGATINAYVARPTGAGPFPSIVLIHHAPGWDEWYFEATRRFAQHGYASICPNLYARAGHGTPEEVGAIVRAAAFDRHMAGSLGVPVARVYALTFAFGVALAGLSGVLLAPIYSVFPTMGRDFVLMAVRVLGKWVFNPQEDQRIEGGNALIVMTTPAGRAAIEKRVGA